MDLETDVEHQIGVERRSRGIDAAIGALAANQHGVVSRAQLVALGLSRGAIGRRIQRRRLHPLHRGVYAVGHRALSREGEWMAAVLACGPDAVLSHRSAAALWGIRPSARRRIEISVPRWRRHRGSVEVYHRVLPADEVTTREGITVTTVPRTLFDLAAVVDERQLERAINEAECSGSGTSFHSWISSAVIHTCGAGEP